MPQIGNEGLAAIAPLGPCGRRDYRRIKKSTISFLFNYNGGITNGFLKAVASGVMNFAIPYDMQVTNVSISCGKLTTFDVVIHTDIIPTWPPTYAGVTQEIYRIHVNNLKSDAKTNIQNLWLVAGASIEVSIESKEPVENPMVHIGGIAYQK